MNETLERTAFAEWLKDDHTERDDTYQYYRGFLVRDREKHPAADDIGSAAWKAYEQGKVSLVQKRKGPFDFSYLAQFIQPKAIRR